MRNHRSSIVNLERLYINILRRVIFLESNQKNILDRFELLQNRIQQLEKPNDKPLELVVTAPTTTYY